ncbi:hypothetical protein L195_g018404 [Trifolium pratense]|uniref:Uncharacterized protein n=1 Tax=Trifolium pratense TaxID=57577 RepID=A0A2K3MWN7_TRIPR|nr:hypothetical protein L195_g018404 [Trifolium pratense]
MASNRLQGLGLIDAKAPFSPSSLLLASVCDPSLFVYSHNANLIYTLIYVVDIIITVKAKPGGHLSLSQGKYIRDLLAKNNMLEAKPFPHPWWLGTANSLKKVNKVCQFMAKPLEAHWLAVKTLDDLKIPQRHSFMGSAPGFYIYFSHFS